VQADPPDSATSEAMSSDWLRYGNDAGGTCYSDAIVAYALPARTDSPVKIRARVSLTPAAYTFNFPTYGRGCWRCLAH